jgi:hypothetical protein
MKIKILIVSYFLVIACFPLKAQLHFTLLKPDQTGIDFVNAIQETAQINEFSYSYLYNGGGVAVGDINNDGLPDLYFSGNMVTNKLYLNLGNFKFKDITDSAGVKGEYGYQTGVTMVDINQDGFLDIYVCKSAMPNTEARRNVLYINNGNLTFTNQAKKYGIDDASYSTQAYFYDMDLDSDLDLFLVNHPYNMKNANSIQLSYDKAGKLKADEDTERTFVSSRYYENINGVFKDKTLAAGLGTHSFGLSAIIDDFNEDGYPDIYLCNDYHKPDYLFINNKNKKYTNKADKFFQHFSYSSMGSDYADINNDGYLDLMVLDMLPETFQRQKLLKGQGNYDNLIKRVNYGFGYQYTKNVLQLNNGNQTYSDISYLSGVAFTDWSWAPLIADFDNDGLKDIYITNGYLRDVTDMDFMMYNSDSLKKELYKTKNSEDAMKVLNGIPSKPTINYYFKNNGNLTFSNINKTCGLDIPSYSNGGVYCDLDNDGDLDLVVNNLFSPPFIYSNNTSENHLANFVRFKLKGETANPFGIGAIVEIETPDGKKQIQHFNPDKGYLSCNEWFVHFGVGKNDSVKVSIIWPNGNSQVLKGLSANNVYTLDIKNSAPKPIVKENTSTVFRDITSKTNVSYNHKENTYIDFKLEPLLPHQFSQMGPCIAVADINGDGLDDFFIGGSKDNDGSVFVQDSSGKFAILKELNISADKKYEDTGAEFIDADNDGDNDLLVVSGGNEYPENENMYPVRLYTNDGKGNFGKNTTSFPSIYTSSKAIAVDDYDNDGDKDIFIGGRVVPGHYGLMPKSYLLQNKNGQFTDITSSVPVIANIGMVTDAIWCDVDNNGWKDLVIVGEWMPLTIFYNINGKLDTTPFILEKSYGWWNTITANDIDKDGDVDLIGGNISANTRYRGNEEYPMTMVVNDFDNNGSTDCIISLYQSDGISYPIALRDNILDQMNYLKKKFLRYKEYSNATINEIFTPEQLSAAKTFKVNCITNTLFVNNGKKNFSMQNLSVKAQIFPINSILADDYDKDGITDLLVAGNDYTTEIESGRNDAGIGLMLIGSGNTKFNSVPVKKSGFYVPGDVKCMKKITVHNKPAIIVGKNKDYLQFIGLTENTN